VSPERPAWYISFHGGKGRDALNNIHAFSSEGGALGKVLDRSSLPKEVDLRELRGFRFGPDGDLYVANAFRGYNQILRFRGSPNERGRHEFVEIFVQGDATNPALAHPFDVFFSPEGHLYVPSQDTNVVARFVGPAATAASRGQPMPYPPALAGLPPGLLAPGTFVPSSEHAPHGLRAVRGALVGPKGQLYVADRDTNAIRVYDGVSGEHVRDLRSPSLRRPIHLHLGEDGALYAGSEENASVLRIDPHDGSFTVVVPKGAGGLDAPSGIALPGDGFLYVGSRLTKQVLRYRVSDGRPDKTLFITGLKDYPEFLLHVERKISWSRHEARNRPSHSIG
jgi:DNA-binding beta-propeller fold protein YncE